MKSFDFVTGTATKPQITGYAIEYKNIQKWRAEFLRKFENSSIKIAGVNSILITKSIDLQLFTLIFYQTHAE